MVTRFWSSLPLVGKFSSARAQARGGAQAGSALKSQARPPKAPDTGKKKGFFRRAAKDTTLRDLKRAMLEHVARARGGVPRRLGDLFRRDTDPIYNRPWFLLLGQVESGKSTMLKRSGLQHTSALYADVLPGEKHCGLWESDSAVVLDVAGDFILRPDLSHHQKGWRKLTALLRRYRNQRPIDGVILAIPAIDLAGQARPADDELRKKGSALFERLRDIEKRLGMRVPVYPVVTRCDAVTGFTEFAGELPQERLSEIFGWTNPYALETGYTPEWVDEAFEAMLRNLHTIQLEVFAGLKETSRGDNIFLLPSEFGSMAGGMQIYTEEIFRSSAYNRVSLLMRGAYFVGDTTLPDPRGTVALDLDLPASLPSSGDSRSPSTIGGGDRPNPTPAFVRDLFHQRIFPEAGIGQPLGGTRLARNRLVLLIQILMGTIALLALLAYFFEYPRLSNSADILRQTLDTVYADLGQVRLRGMTAPDKDYVLYAEHILDGLTRVENNRLTSPLFPSSWFSPLHTDIQRAFGRVYERVILRAMKYQLEKKATTIPTEILDRPPPDTTDNWIFAVDNTIEYKDLERYVRRLLDLEASYKRFNALAKTKSLEDVRLLVRYLFNRELTEEFLEHGDYYRDAIEFANIAPFTPRPYEDRAIEGADTLLSSLMDRMFTRNVILRGIRLINGDVTTLTTTGAGGGFESVQTMRRLGRNIVNLKSALADPRTAWISRPSFTADSSLVHLLKNMDSSAFLHSGGRSRAFTDTASFRFKQLLHDILDEPNDAIGPIVRKPDAGQALQLVPEIDSLRGAIVGLLAQRFMRATRNDRISPRRNSGNIVLWNTGQLDEALKLQEPYNAFLDKGIDAFPPGLQDPVRNVARNGLEATMASMVIPAQRTQPNGGTADDVQREIQGIKGATPQFEQLLGLFSQLQVSAYNDLRNALRVQAAGMLTDLNALLAKTVSYDIPDSRLDLYESDQKGGGGGLLGSTLIDAGDEGAVAEYLTGPREQLSRLATEFATPIVAFAGSIGGTGLDAENFWRKIISELTRYQNKVPGNSVAVMEDLFLDLNNITPDNYSDHLKSRGSSDYFLRIRQDLRDRLWAMFGRIVLAKALKAWEDLRGRFNSLQGRFPFDRSSIYPSLTPSISLEEMRAFVAQFDDFHDRYKGIWSGWNRQGASAGELAAWRFIQKMEDVEYFLSPLFGADTANGLLLMFDVEFRKPFIQDKGGDQIIEWRLDIGRQSLTLEDYLRRGIPLRATWQVGDRVRLTLRWARNSNVKPASIPALPPFKHAIVDMANRTVTYSFNDPWALIRMLVLHKVVKPTSMMGPQTLELKINVTPDIRRDDQVTLFENPPSQTAIVYMRIGVLGRSHREALMAPDFPTDPLPPLN